MLVAKSPSDIPHGFGPTVVSIGNFDGVHLGHRLVLDRVRESAASRSLRSVAVTFDPHPSRMLRPENGLKLITPLATRLDLLEATGIDAVLVLPFTAALSGMRAREFITAILRDALRAVEVHEGPNFRFGYRAEGGTRELQELGREMGFGVVVHPACSFRGLTVSSSKIRELIAQGEMRMARGLLGHPFFVDSTAAAGRGIGRTLTVPTINLAPYSELLPLDGVYVSRLRAGEEWFDAVTNIGHRPTFAPDSFAVESYLLNFHPIELGEQTPLRLVFCQRLRDEQQWPSPEALKAQILRDAGRAQRYLRRLRSLEEAAASTRSIGWQN